MGVVIYSSNSNLPGLNFEAPPSIRDLEFVFDRVFAGEQRTRLQLLMGQYRDEGPAYGIVDQRNPASAASSDSTRPLVVRPNAGNPLTADVLPGIAVTKSGNVVVLTEPLFGLDVAQDQSVVLVEYSVTDDEATNVVTDYNTVEAVRRVVSDPTALVRVVSLSDYNDPSIFSAQRLNDVVVLAVVIRDDDEELTIDMSNAVNRYVRPWFSAIDQEHRSWVGTGAEEVPHRLSYNDLGGGDLTLYQQALQHGVVLSRDMDVPGCPGKLCSELVDHARVYTDDNSGTVTGVPSQRYVRLTSYPTRILGARGNTLSGQNVVPDTSVTAQSLAVELIPGTNILKLGRRSNINEGYDTAYGFTVYYTSSDAVRPPALPYEIMLVAGDVIQFGSPDSTREGYVTGGKIYSELPATTYAVGTNGPIPKNYRLWLDASRQFVQGPQIVVCGKLLAAPLGVGIAIQNPEFPMYGPARIRAALWNAGTGSTMTVRVELSGKNTSGEVITETLVFSGTSGSPNPIAWNQNVGADGEPTNAFQISTNVFAKLDTWKIKQAPIAAGSDAVIQLWAEIGPTVTPAIDDAMPVCSFIWNGQSVVRIRDERQITRRLEPTQDVSFAQMVMMGHASGTYANPLAAESFKDPVLQDNVLSRRDRHSGSLRTCAHDVLLTGFNPDGTHPGREWYYSRSIMLPTTGTSETISMVLFGELPLSSQSNEFGDDALVEYQVAESSTPTVFGAWTAMPKVNSNPRRRSLSVSSTKFKIRFRIAGRGLSGYSITIT